MKLLKLLFILTITQIAAPLGIGLALEQEAPLKEKVSFLSCNFQDSCIQAITRGDQETAEFAGMCRAGSGNLVNQLCSMDNAIGRCVVAHEKTTYIHYETKDHLEQVKNSCALANGTWHKLVFKEQAAEEAKLFYAKSMPTKDHERTFLQKLEDLTHWILRKHQSTKDLFLKNERRDRQAHPDWMGNAKLEVHREIFKQLDKGGGGCGTLSTFLCAQRLGADMDLPEIDKAFQSKAGTTSGEHRALFNSKGYLTLSSDLNPACSSYQSMETWLDRGCSIEVTMRSMKEGGHVEFLDNVGFYEDLCWGITNSWGSAAVIEGGYGSFYHSHLPIFDGDSAVAITKICHHTSNNALSLESEFIGSLNNPNSSFVRGDNLVSGIDLLLMLETPQRVEETLLTHGTQLNLADAGGNTPLNIAVQEKDSKAVKILADVGANLNQPNAAGRTPLWMAIREKEANIVQILAHAGALKTPPYTRPPLDLAISEGAADIVQILIDAGADIDEKYLGQSPWDLAWAWNNPEIIEILRRAHRRAHEKQEALRHK